MSAISAIIPTCNRRAFLEEAVTALERQSRRIEQIVIWDDGSTDGTEAYARALDARSGGRILYRRGENRGKSSALNAALLETTGEYIWICDDDDVAVPNAAERLAATLDACDAGLAAGRHVRFRDDPGTGKRQFMGTGYWPDLREGSVLRHVLEDVFFFQNGTLVRRTALDRVGPFREDLARSIDYEMMVRLAARFPVAMIDEVLFHQRKHDGARGPVALRHAVADSEEVWLDHDRAIFADFRTRLPLALYESLFDSDLPVLRRRAALMQRGCVYARRTDWEAALSDFREAAGTAELLPLTATERTIGLRAMAGKHGCGGAFRQPVSDRLLALRDLGPVGAQIASALGRGAVWRARRALARRDIAEAARILGFVARMSGVPELRVGQAGRLPQLREKRTLAAGDYAW